jgi:hypothetical protein
MMGEPRTSSGRRRPWHWRGGCLRGLAWALLFETAILAMLAFLIYSWRTLRL